jgi:predicted AAA+ superfamily ATPase
MQKSFHLALIRPFYQNTRKELIKMPKIYFYDLGMRNFFYGDFSPPATRQDIGLLLENSVFRQLLDRYNDLEKIKFWRTINKNEIDFIIGQKQAFEVKTSSARFNPAKYQQFRQLYPDIELKLVSYKKDAPNCLLPFEI